MTTPSASMASAVPSKSRVIVPKASEKRKAQNRAAQKTYREKKKQRLHELEQLAATVGLHQDGLAVCGAEDEADNVDENRIKSTIPALDSQSSSQSPPDFPSWDLPLEYTGQAVKQSQLDATTQPRIFDLDNIVDEYSWLSNEVDSVDTTWTNQLQPNAKSTTMFSPQTSTSTSEELMLHIASRSFLADPQSNQLSFRTTAIYAAFIQNLLHLGMSSTDPCQDETPSIFYRPNLSSSSEQALIVAAVQNSFSGIKRDLRPTSNQIIRKHPGYIDILPFPDMRDRLIELITAEPPMVDEDEFWHDMDNGGLICWGSISPGHTVTPAGGGAPWDARSWEAKRWFLNKWNFLVGGEDSELARSSHWWRTMRGEGQGFSF